MALLTRSHRVRACAVAAAMAVVCPRVSAQQAEDGANAVKATFLYNFTKFIDWPTAAFEGISGPFRVCVFADIAFGRAIEATLRGETIRSRPIEVLTPATVESTRTCHIAYFDRGQMGRAGKLLPSLGQATVLTVGDGPQFLEHGVAIAFILENNRIRFDVNIPAVDRAGLTVSSKLLRVARNVDRGMGR
jgi:hypothetical protein